MQRPSGASSTSRCDGNNLPSWPAADGSGTREAPGPAGPDGHPRSERGVLRGAGPFRLKRKGSADRQQQGQAAPKSRLCAEASHESPIQAVRKPPVREASLGFDSDEESARGSAAVALLRKLFCLKAAPSRLKKPGGPPEKASPFCRENKRCGTVAALSGTADAQGESPLRWKPRAEAQGPAEAPPVPAEVKEDAAGGQGGWRAVKPWRTLRTLMVSGRRTRRDAPEAERSGGETAEEGDPSLPAEPLAGIPAGEPPSTAADREAGSARPPSPDGACRGPRETWAGWESHAKPGRALAAPGGDREAEKPSGSMSGRRSHWAELPGPEDTSELFPGLSLPGGGRIEAGGLAVEDQGPELAALRAWLEENEDLADLAENPGGQGMVMATGDLGWLDREALGGPGFGTGRSRVGQSAELCPGSHPESQEAEGQKVGMECAEEEGLGRSFFLTHDTGNGSPEAPGSVLGDASGTQCLTGVGPQLPGSPLELHPLFSPRGLEPSTPGLPLSEKGIGCQQEYPTLAPPSLPGERDEGRGPLEATETRTAQEKQLLYATAAEIVGAAIDAAAEQLAKKPEGAGLGRSRHFP